MAWLVQLVLWLVVWRSPLRHGRRTRVTPEMLRSGDKPGVSILVYSHDQAESLARNLPVLLEQDYPEYEVVVVDDCSRDDTQDILSMLDQRYEHLVHTRIDSHARAMSHRKLAVYLGTKASHHDLLLVTRAECCPSSPDWISGMVRHFAQPGIEVVLGPVVYERRASFLSRFCQFDLFSRLLWMLGVALSVKPFAGWGQNLAFRKSTFFANGSQGFQRHLNIQPGEDDLFVADVARPGNVAVEMQASSLVTDQSRPLVVNWSIDRINRGFTSRLYSWSSAILRAVDHLSAFITVLCGWTLIIYNICILCGPQPASSLSLWPLCLAVLLLLARFVLQYGTIKATWRHLHLKPMSYWLTLFDLYMPVLDLWYRCKALMRSRRFSVGRIGLQ